MKSSCDITLSKPHNRSLAFNRLLPPQKWFVVALTFLAAGELSAFDASAFQRTLAEIKKLGITTVIVEQNAIAALQLADRAIILDMGQVVFDGTAEAVLNDAALRQEYLAI